MPATPPAALCPPRAPMCTEHVASCPVCGKDYLTLVAFCDEYRPAQQTCARGKTRLVTEMAEGDCPSPVCPHSRTGGCSVI